MSALPNPPLGDVTSLREELWDAGFRPVPVYNIDANHPSPGKAPMGIDWPESARMDPPEAVRRTSASALNTGILCDGLRALDLDLESPQLVARIRAMAVFRLGEAPMRVRSNSPRCLLLYRAAVGEPPKRLICGTEGKVEVLGRGQQFVAFGKHPSGVDLHWTPEAPNAVIRTSLPAITEEQVGAFLCEIAPLIGASSERAQSTVNPEDSKETRALIAELRETGAGHVNVMLDLETDLVGRLQAALTDRPRLRARWDGFSDDMVSAGRDTSRSGMDFSLAALLKGAGFLPIDVARILLAYQHGAAFDDLKHPDEGARLRYVARTAQRASMARSAARPSTPSTAEVTEGGSTTPSSQDASRRTANLPAIQVTAGEIDLIATAGEDALLAAKLPVFRRDKLLVRPVWQKVPASGGRMTVSAGLDTITQPALVDLLNQAVAWERYNQKEKEWKPTDPPTQVAAVILSRAALSRLPNIAGVITTPTLRPDGSVLAEPGYDPATRLYLVHDPALRMPEMPKCPTRNDAGLALDGLQQLLAEFPFVGEVDRAVALSAIITAVVRGAISVAPMHAFRAATAGSGKSFLADLVSSVASGRPCPVMAASEKEDETEKRLVGLLLAGVPIISLDNVNGELGGDLLCQAIERPLVRVRSLGTSEITEIESRAMLLATGNALRVRGDMTRRTLLCGLDPKMERPELRSFNADPVADVLQDRGRYVAACLTIVRAFLHAGKPGGLSPMASFEEWNAWVRGALLWLGCGDPAASMEDAREDDPELSELRDVLGPWKDAIGVGQGITIRDLDALSARYVVRTTANVDLEQLEYPDLRDALMHLGGERGTLNGKRLGQWLMAREGKIVAGLRFRRMGRAKGGVVRWGVETV